MIDFPEFCHMMYALTPKSKGILEATEALCQAQEALDAALKAVDAAPDNEAAVTALGTAYADLIMAENVMEGFTAEHNPEPMTPKKVMDESIKAGLAVGQTFETLRSLRPEIQGRILRPQDHQRAGRIIQRMKKYEKMKFTDKDINNVIKSLTAEHPSEMEQAFELWAGEDLQVDTSEFIEVVPLLGEDLTEEEITCMFAHADKDGSGHIDLPEFKELTAQMQMQGDGRARHMVVGMARAQAYANTKK